MSEPWAFSGPVASLGTPDGSVTLVAEATFSICSTSSDMHRGVPHGLFVGDTRIISRWELVINGTGIEVLATSEYDPSNVLFIARASSSAKQADSSLMVFRHRYIGDGMREDLVLRNYSAEPAYCLVELLIEADFEDIFAVKEGRVSKSEDDVSVETGADNLKFSYTRGGVKKGCSIYFNTATKLDKNMVTFEVVVPSRGEWSTCIQVVPVVDDKPLTPRYICGEPIEYSTSKRRLDKWRNQAPQVDTNCEKLKTALLRSTEDLGALRIFDPDFPDRVVVAAGAPWFMTVFGRDSLFTAWMALMVDPDIALGVLQTLARFQGKVVDPRTDEQPGRILHEIRFSNSSSLSLGGGSIYYGTVDATPLFVMLLGELRRWGLASQVVDELLPHADRALEWVEAFGDLDGDGYVEYQRLSDRGLANQGWKDSWDGIRYADGRVASSPIALCEVQGYIYGAYLARAHFAKEQGDNTAFERYRLKAATLRANFNRDFWLADKGYFAIGLDADKHPIDSLASNMGHCLWTGIVDEDKAPLVASKLLAQEMFTGWGIRTLATSMGGYNPISYHCGSVWPHDTVITASGLMRYGFVKEAHTLLMGLLDVSQYLGGRLPELFGGLDRLEYDGVVRYPTSSSPQAWAAASPFLILRTLLRLDPWLPYGQTWIAPVLPKGISYLKVEGIPLGGSKISVEAMADGSFKVEGLPSGIDLVAKARGPITAVLVSDISRSRRG
ncbi:MAG: amylo-alpha-1,6-glucosidase [Actinobacteria bacterium]|nr:amylo-alpha-1,6-glucosidase [Actinomycetota bacterium]MCL6104248.1 amylo-alpha-1,6-glucosidase [Actinomycetota bacterium]